MTSSLPADVLALVEMNPVEDLLLALLREKIPSIPVKSLIEDDQTFPFILVRRLGDWGEWNGDPRFLDAAQVSVQTVVQGVEGDKDAALLAEACRVALRDSINVVMPGLGYLTKVRMSQSPKRVTDWATATGPVQYADLPTGVWRYETRYEVEIRKPATKPYPA